MIGNLDPESFGIRIENENGKKPFDFLPETVLGLQDGPISSFLQREGKFLVALGISREALRCDHFAQFPRIGIGKIGLGLVDSTTTAMKRMMNLAAKPGSVDLLRLFEPVDFERTFGDPSLAIEGSGLEGYLHGLARGLPILGREGCLQSDEPDVHAAFPGTGLSRTIHHVGVDGIAESGFVLLGNREIGLGRELDLEGTVRTGPGRTMSDFLSRRRREGSPPVMPAQPGRKAHLPDHAVLDLSVIDGGPGIGHGRPTNLDLAVEHGRLGRGVHRYLELGTLVLLDGNRGGTARGIRALDLDAHSAHETVTRSGEAPVEGSIVVGTVLEPGDLLVVAVAKDHREVSIGDHLVVVVLLIDAVRNPLVTDGLAGAVEAAVGKENRTLVRPALAVVIIHVIGIGRG